MTWKKGQSGNPAGSSKLAREIGGLRKKNRAAVERAIDKLIQLSSVELAKVVSDPKTPVLELVLARVIQKAVSKGEMHSFDRILDRSIGKTTNKHEVVAPKPFIIKKTDGSEEHLGFNEDDEGGSEQEKLQ